jgi:hypothetical protein
MPEYAKDRVLRVDTPGQQVSPRVRYVTTCLLIRDDVGSVPYSVEWEIGVVSRARLTRCKRGRGSMYYLGKP